MLLTGRSCVRGSLLIFKLHPSRQTPGRNICGSIASHSKASVEVRGMISPSVEAEGAHKAGMCDPLEFLPPLSKLHFPESSESDVRPLDGKLGGE